MRKCWRNYVMRLSLVRQFIGYNCGAKIQGSVIGRTSSKKEDKFIQYFFLAKPEGKITLGETQS